MTRYGRDFWGSAQQRDRFPILVKQLHARFPLPLQVHPTDGSERKNECWYVKSSMPGGWVINRWAGEDFLVAQSIPGPDPLAFLIRDPVTPGTLITVPAGGPHALGPEVVALEIQDTADVTIRISLWGHDEWNLPIDGHRASEEFSRMRGRPQVLEGEGRQWVQQDWQVQVMPAETLRLDPRTPTVVINGNEMRWQMHSRSEVWLVNGLEAAMVLPGQSVILESLQGHCEWVVCEAR